MSKPQRRTEYMPLLEITRAKRNPKKHDIPNIKRSYERFGAVESPVLDERTGRLVAGHGRLQSLRELHDAGAKPPDGIKIQGDAWLVPVQRGWASKDDTEAEAYLLASNKLTELGGWHQAELDKLLAELATADALDGVGFEMPKLSRTAPQLGDLEYRVVVDCADEADQVQLLLELEQKGRACRALIS